MKEKIIENKCKKCQNFGWWPIGSLSSIGPMDAREWGEKVIQCPWCGKPSFGVKKGERYKILKDIYDKEIFERRLIKTKQNGKDNENRGQ